MTPPLREETTIMTAEKPTNIIEKFAPYPKTEEEATAQNVYRYLLVAAYVTNLRKVRPFTEPGGPTDVRQHMDAIETFVAEWSTLHLLRVLIGYCPDMADFAARDMWLGWEDGGGPVEVLWDWLAEAGIAPEDIEKAYEEVRPY